jgi:ATP-dependent DNA helicase RecG
VETYPYPKEALREAIYNAIVHKNYATLIPIQISVYADKIYIGNDCVFPEDWTVDDLLGKHRSRPYNPLIANTFFRAGYIEAWGRGIEKIKESCMENGNDMAEYQVRPSEVMVVFHGLHEETHDNTQDNIENTQDNTQDVTPNTQDVIDKERKILVYCEMPRSKKEIAEHLGYKTIKSIKADVESLLAGGKIVMTIPDKPEICCCKKISGFYRRRLQNYNVKEECCICSTMAQRRE